MSIPNRLQTSFIRWDNKLVPRSERRVSGTPKTGMIIISSTNNFTTFCVFWSGTGNTIGHLVRKSWKTITCLFPCSVFGRSITSTPSIWKGLLTGIGFNAGRPGYPAPLTTAHWGQSLQWVSTSRNIPSHHQVRARAL